MNKKLPEVIHVWKKDMTPPKEPGGAHKVEVLRPEYDDSKPDANWAEYRLVKRVRK